MVDAIVLIVNYSMWMPPCGLFCIQISQFSTLRPGTRKNSASLSVTRVQSSARAWAAIKVALGPMKFSLGCGMC